MRHEADAGAAPQDGSRAIRLDGPVMKAAAAAAALWIALVAAYAAGFFGFFGETGPGWRASAAFSGALFLLAALAPAAMIVMGAAIVRLIGDLRAASDRLRRSPPASVEAGPAAPAAGPSAAELDRLADALRAEAAEAAKAAEDARAETAASLARLEASLADTRAALAAAPQAAQPLAEGPEKTTEGVRALAHADQPALPLDVDAVAGRGGVAWSSVVRALDFPRDSNDKEGFRALRDVVKDREFAELLQAAEDVLTLLAADGLYMEDLTPNPAPAEIWRAYASGARGVEVAALAGITDDAAVASARARMRANAVFRDATLHFLRRFDRLMSRMDRELGDDPLLAAVGDTRTGRAFMLIAKVAGVFERGRGRAPKP